MLGGSRSDACAIIMLLLLLLVKNKRSDAARHWGHIMGKVASFWPLGKIYLISAKFCRFFATLACFRACFALFFRKVELIQSQSHYMTPLPAATGTP